MRPTLATALTLCGLLAGLPAGRVWGQVAAPAPLVVEATPAAQPAATATDGRDLRHWSPPRWFDVDRMVLHLDLPDLTKAELTCSQALTIISRGRSPDILLLDAHNSTMKVSGVKVGGAPAAFTHEDNELEIDIPPAAGPGEKREVLITYSLHGPFPEGNALVFTPAKAGRSALMFSQGETRNSHYWFPCRDEPDTKIGVTEMFITPPAGTEALASGVLVKRTKGEGERETFHFRLDKPNSAYLTVVAVGTFEKKEQKDPAGKVELAVYRPKGAKGEFSPVFDKTGAMLDFYRTRLGVEFPWPIYRQLQIKGFTWNGMENTTLTTLDLDIDNEHELELTVAHELFHHWFGDSVTCAKWDDVWVQEGWATYAEGLWLEHTGGAKAYRQIVGEWMRDVSRRSRGDLPTGKPLVHNRWKEPDETFDGVEDPYSRGGMILHMLRHRLGDEAFFRGTKLFLERHAYGSVETVDLRRAYEDASGDSLAQFFDQWTARPGIPRVTLTAEWIDADKSLVVTARQTQTIDELNPAYAFDLPLSVQIGDGNRELTLSVDSLETTARFILTAEPQRIEVDRNLTVMAGLTPDGTPTRGKPVQMTLPNPGRPAPASSK